MVIVIFLLIYFEIGHLRTVKEIIVNVYEN